MQASDEKENEKSHILTFKCHRWHTRDFIEHSSEIGSVGKSEVRSNLLH